ncbi:MAG: CPBP family intramembrane glutamic endopeptidase [Terriglobales bacterium]
MSANEFAPPAPAEVSDRRPVRRSRARSVGAAALIVILSLPLPGWLVHGESLPAQVWRELVFWALTLVLLAYILLVERRPLSSIGLERPNWKTAAFGALGALAMVGGMAFIYMVIYPALGLSASEPGMAAVTALPFWLRVLIVVRAAVFEEMYFRGFAIERLTDILGSRRGAAALSFVAFTFEHLGYWGWAHLMIAGFGGVILTGLYLWRRDLGANIIAHLLTDAVGFLLG